MKKEPFNPEKYFGMLKRANALQARIKHKEADNTYEHETALRLLKKLHARLEEYRLTHEIPESFNNVSSSTANEIPTNFESNPLDKFGVLYAIFGVSYQTIINYHTYVVEFTEPQKKSGAFYRVNANIFEDGVLICKDITFGFWPWSIGDDTVQDMEVSTMYNDNIKKYNCWHIFKKIANEMMEVWNYFMEDKRFRLEDNSSSSTAIEITPDSQRRDEIIRELEKQILTGELKNAYENRKTSSFTIKASESYKSLKDFLENSGVVYKVSSSTVYIWDPTGKNPKFKMLLNFEYIKVNKMYTVMVLEQ